MADGGLSIFIALASTGAKLATQKSAKDAADAQSQSSQNFLERKQENERLALVENTKRQQQNKERQMAQVRASQAAGGFSQTSGTPLAVFGEIESRLDEQINEQTNRALDALSSIKSQRDNLAYADSLRDSAYSTNLLATGIAGVASYAVGYKKDYQASGDDPFGIFPKAQTE
jgi:hypothetical protein